MPEATKSSPPRGRGSSSSALSFPLPSPARKLTSLASFSLFLSLLLLPLLLASDAAAAASSPAAPALGEALAFDSSPEPGAVRAFSEVERRAGAACSSSAECRAACGVGVGGTPGGSSSSSPAAAAADVTDWVTAPPSDLQRAREQLLACVNAFRSMPGAFSKEVGDACDASGWLPQLEFARSAAWAPSNASAASPSSPRSPFLLDGVPALELAAQAAVDDMVEFDYFGHVRPVPSGGDGSSSAGAAAAEAAAAPAAPAARVRRATPGASRVGALIASGWRSPLDVVTQMACSEKHRGVLLDCRFDAAGWGAAFPSNREWKSYYAIYLVCLDPRGCAACPAVEGEAAPSSTAEAAAAAAARAAEAARAATTPAEPKGVEWSAADVKGGTDTASSPSATAAPPAAPTPEETEAAAAAAAPAAAANGTGGGTTAPDPGQLAPPPTETAPAGTPAAAAAVPTMTESPQTPPPPPSTPEATTVAATPAPPPPPRPPPPSKPLPPSSPPQLCAINMQFGSGAAAASSPSGKPALLLLTSTGSSGGGGGGGAAGEGGSGERAAPVSLSPSDVEATLLSAPGRPRARVSSAFPHGGSGAFVVALDLPSNYTGEVSVAVAGSGSGSGSGEKRDLLLLSPLTFAVVRSPRVLVTASLPVE